MYTAEYVITSMNYNICLKMKNLQLVILICVFCFNLVGCNSNESHYTNVINIEKAIENGDKNIKLSELVSSLEYIPINTGDGFLSDFNKMNLIPAKDGFYMVPMTFGREPFYKFSKDGNIVYQFNKQGRAKDEYSTIRSVSYAPDDDIIIVTDLSGKILSYTGNGNCLDVISTREINGYSTIQNAFYIGEKLTLFAKKADMSQLCAIVIDSAGNILKNNVIYKYRDGLFAKQGYVTSEKMYQYNGNIRIMNDYSDTLFSYNDENLNPIYSFHLGKYGSGDEKKINIGGKNYESEQFLLLQIIFSPKFYDNMPAYERINYLLYNKSTGHTIMIAKNNDNKICFENDIDSGLPFWPAAIYDGKMYQVVDAIEFINYAKISSSVKIKEIAQTLTETSNPVVVIAKLK